jgi:hypothetical protein
MQPDILSACSLISVPLSDVIHLVEVDLLPELLYDLDKMAFFCPEKLTALEGLLLELSGFISELVYVILEVCVLFVGLAQRIL